MCLAGSRAYGTSRPDSDTDIRGVFIAPAKSFLGLNEPPQEFELEGDTKFFELKKFLKLCMAGNPQQLEILHSDSITVPKLTDGYYANVCWTVIEFMRKQGYLWNRHGIYNAYSGYAHGEYKWLDRNQNGHRFFKRWGHVFRLMEQGQSVLKDGILDVRLSQSTIDFILEIFSAKFTHEQLTKKYHDEYGKLNECYQNSKLPMKANFEKVDFYLKYMRSPDCKI